MRPVSCNSRDAGVGQMTGHWVAQRADTSEVCPVLLSGSAQRLGSLTERWKGPVMLDQTRPMDEKRFWNLTGNDWTLVAQRPVSYSVAFDHFELQCPVII